MSDRDRLKAWLVSVGFAPNTSVSVFDLKPGEFMEPPEEYVRDREDHSILFGDGHGYRGTYFSLDFDEAGRFVGQEFLGVGVKKFGDDDLPVKPEKRGWEPISTAPKDGTWVLMCRHGQCDVARWQDDLFGDGKEWGGGGWSYPEWNLPTHWMPLPAPPEGVTSPVT